MPPPHNPPWPHNIVRVNIISRFWGAINVLFSRRVLYYVHVYIHMYVCTSFSTHTPGHPVHSTQRCNNVILSWHNSQCKHQHYQSGIYSLSILLSGRSVGRVVVHLCNHRLINSQRINLSPSHQLGCCYSSINHNNVPHSFCISLLGLHPHQNPHS